MKVIITEDIIRKALNESIDGFLIKEGLLDGSILGSAWNGLKNATAAFMDKRTNGQWNRKYGIYPKANGKTGELYYFNKWLTYYYKRLNSIIYQANTPSREDDYDTWVRNTNDPTHEYKKVNKYNYVGIQGALEFAEQYCTADNFNIYIRSLNPNREAVYWIDAYINKYITGNAKSKNIKDLLKCLNIYTFYSSQEFKKYLAMDRSAQQANAKQSREEREQETLNKEKEQQGQPHPIPTNSNGEFGFDKERGLRYPFKPYEDWFYSYDGNGAKIIVNSNNPTQAKFVSDNGKVY